MSCGRALFSVSSQLEGLWNVSVMLQSHENSVQAELGNSYYTHHPLSFDCFAME